MTQQEILNAKKEAENRIKEVLVEFEMKTSCLVNKIELKGTVFSIDKDLNNTKHSLSIHLVVQGVS